MNKSVTSAVDAVRDIASGSSLAVGGFGVCGVPDVLLDALLDAGSTNLTVYSNNCGIDDYGLGPLLAAGRIHRFIASYVGENAEFARQYLSGAIELELTPQGTLAERLRAGGAGIPAFYTPTGVGTPIADGGMPWRYHSDGTIAVSSPAKEIREFGGRTYVLEEAITTDYALVHAAVGDTHGNLVFNKSARNFNPAAAMAAKTCIAQVETLVDLGEIDPDHIHLSGIFVDRIVETGPQLKLVEKRTVTTSKASS
ncbi:CoA transferase subunit A [Mycobacteriaceae bacterium NPDC060252]